MCGIAGLCGPDVDVETARSLIEPLHHRGPDGHGVWLSPTGHAALAHRRLAVIDLSAAGSQPMERGHHVISYNGEVYNFEGLRAELARTGAEFSSGTDTEVVLELLRREGSRGLHRLHGMFAFALWNERDAELLLVRDRLGIKPLYYRLGGGRLYFSSELTPLAHIPELGSCTLDDSALRDFFTYKYVPTPKTIYREITKLPPGHCLRWSPGAEGPQLECYWEARSSEERTDLIAAVDELDQLLDQVIDQHTLADVAVGVFLSGGVDSSTVAAHLSSPRTFNLGFDVRSHDETDAANAIADHLGTVHHTLKATGSDLGEALDLIARIYDEPFGDHGAFPVFQIARLARTHPEVPVTVALTGEGGDELFAGYPWYHKQHRRPGWLPRLLLVLAPPSSAAFRSSERRLMQGVERYAAFLGPFTNAQKRWLLSGRLMEDEGYDDLWAFRRHWREDLPIVKRLQWMDVHGYLRDDMMTKLDRATMAVSLEARPPLVDHRVVEFALSLHSKLLHQQADWSPRNDQQVAREPHLRGKVVLRRALRRHVPEQLLTPRKVGFSAPIRRWSQRDPEHLARAQARLYERGILARRSARLATNEQTWCVLVLDRWLERHHP